MPIFKEPIDVLSSLAEAEVHLRKQNEELQTTLDKATAAIQNQELQEVREQNIQLPSEREATQQAAAAVEVERRKIKKERERLEKDYEEKVKAEKARLGRENEENLQKEKPVTGKQIASLENDKDSLLARISILEDELQKLRKEGERYRIDRIALQDRLQTLEYQLENERSRFSLHTNYYQSVFNSWVNLCRSEKGS